MSCKLALISIGPSPISAAAGEQINSSGFIKLWTAPSSGTTWHDLLWA